MVPSKGDFIEGLARVGYVAKGVVYLMIGGITVWLLVGPGNESNEPAVGPGEALGTLAGTGFGSVLLGLMALGLLAYAAWRWTQAALDPENAGSDAKGLAKRFGYACSGTVYAALALQCVLLILGAASDSGPDAATKWSRKLMALPFGHWVLGAIGVGIAIAGCYQLYRGWTKNFCDELKLDQMTDRQRTLSGYIGQAGFIARGIVYLIIAALAMKAAVASNAGTAGGIGEALTTLTKRTYGEVALAAVAGGLFLYGLFAVIVLAPYRRIRAE